MQAGCCRLASADFQGRQAGGGKRIPGGCFCLTPCQNFLFRSFRLRRPAPFAPWGGNLGEQVVRREVGTLDDREHGIDLGGQAPIGCPAPPPRPAPDRAPGGAGAGGDYLSRYPSATAMHATGGAGRSPTVESGRIHLPSPNTNEGYQ